MQRQCVLRQPRFASVVLDSSVLDPSTAVPRGASYQVVRSLRASRFDVALSVPLALAYEAVLSVMPRSLAFLGTRHTGSPRLTCATWASARNPLPWRPALTDPHDEVILELAVAARCDAIVTHNLREFVGAARFGVTIVTPAGLLRGRSRHDQSAV